MIEVTSIGFALIISILTRATNMAGILLVSSVLQAASVFNIITPAASLTGASGYGVTPFHLMASVILIKGFFEYKKTPFKIWPKYLNLPMGLLLAYVLTSALGSFIFPYIFEDIHVNALIKMYGFNATSGLFWSISNAAQCCFLILNFLTLMVILNTIKSKEDKKLIFSGVWISCAIVLSLGCYEQLASYYGWHSTAVFLANNPGYHQAPVATEEFILKRVGLPFSEPSYASAFMSAIFVGVIAVATSSGGSYLWIAASIICLLGLFNILGSTGLVATFFALIVLITWRLWELYKKRLLHNYKIRTLYCLIVLIMISILAYQLYEKPNFKFQIDKMAKILIIDKTKLQVGVRELSNQRAVELVKETNGFGVGLGSHRASSFLASLLANTGILGFSLFLGMLSTLLWRYWKKPILSNEQIFVAAALSTVTLAMSIGIPDLNMPMYWCFIILGFVFCPGDEVEETNGGRCPSLRG
jgi:hypothetical protein